MTTKAESISDCAGKLLKMYIHVYSISVRDRHSLRDVAFFAPMQTPDYRHLRKVDSLSIILFENKHGSAIHFSGGGGLSIVIWRRNFPTAFHTPLSENISYPALHGAA